MAYFCAAILLVLLIGAVIALAVAIGFVVMLDRESSKSESDTQICLTPSCVEAAAFILENIDTDIDPCEDFYNFTCGKWAMKNNVPAGTLPIYTIADDRQLGIKPQTVYMCASA